MIYDNGRDQEIHGGSIKMMQFRSQYNETCDSYSEGWVELFEHDNFRGRSLLIDFPDRFLEDYFNYDHAEGFEDKASSARWCLPKELTFNLYTEKDQCRGLYRLTGYGTMREIPNLHRFGYGDKFSCSEYIIDYPARLSIDPATGGVFSYSFPVSSSVQVLSSDANPTINVDVPAGAFADPLSLEIQPNTPPEHNTSLYGKSTTMGCVKVGNSYMMPNFGVSCRCGSDPGATWLHTHRLKSRRPPTLHSSG